MNGAPASPSAYTATVPIPIAAAVLRIRRAISPRFATSSVVITAGTPRTRGPPATGPLWHADSAMAITVRVSLGSMMPSSATRPVAYSASDPASA